MVWMKGHVSSRTARAPMRQVALAAEAAIERKVAMIRQDQEKRVQALEERQEMMLQHAQLAEAWADEVEKVRFYSMPG